MDRISRYFLIVLLHLATVAAHAQAPDSEFSEVDGLLRDGSLVELAALYDRILETYPKDRRALLGRAAAYSWDAQRTLARATFHKVIALYPGDIDAITGLAYDFAWGGDYAEAETNFFNALHLDSSNASAQKGLAFTYLWSGAPQSAEAWFRAVVAADPKDAEAQRGIGQALIAQRRGLAAELAFQQALQIDPADVAARHGIRAARDIGGPIEAAVWFGDSAAGGDVDIRAMQLTSFIGEATSIRFRLDDSLSLDNPVLARSGEDARATFVSATHAFGSRLVGSVEVGQRELPGEAKQDIYKIEASIPGVGRTWRFGYQDSPHSDGFNDSLVFGGLSFALSDRLTLDSTIFLADTGIAGDDEYRGVVALHHRAPRGWSVGGGVGIGHISSEDPLAKGRVTTANLIAGWPVTRSVSTYFQLRWESAPLVDFTVATLGVVVRPGRR
jgi:tetratricopeptide (TPR) repeat protein